MATVTHQSYLTSPSLKKPHHLSSYQNRSLSFPQHPSSCSLRSSFLHSDGSRASFSISSTKKGKGNASNSNSNEDASKKKRSSASVEQKFTYEGSITESLPNGMFYVRLDNEDVILGYISGKIRRNFVRVLPGDRVTVEVSRYDSTRGRIIYRLRNKKDGTD